MKLNRPFALLGTLAGSLASAGMAAAQTVPTFVAPQTYITNGPAGDGPSTYWSAAGDFSILY